MGTPFLYFLPLARADTLREKGPRILAERGLGEVLADVRGADDLIVSELNKTGPGERTGVLLLAKRPGSSAADLPRRTGYYPDAQRWIPAGDPQKAWIGLDREDPPTPADLQRRTPAGGLLCPDGYPITLADGNQWLVPIARWPRWRPDATFDRDADADSKLPRRPGWDPETGEFRMVVKETYRDLYELAGEIAAMYYDQQHPKTYALEEATLWAVAGLAVNYRFGCWEQELLGVIDSTNLEQILAALVDYPHFRELYDRAAQKKSETGAASTGGPGSEATADASGE